MLFRTLRHARCRRAIGHFHEAEDESQQWPDLHSANRQPDRRSCVALRGLGQRAKRRRKYRTTPVRRSPGHHAHWGRWFNSALLTAVNARCHRNPIRNHHPGRTTQRALTSNGMGRECSLAGVSTWTPCAAALPRTVRRMVERSQAIERSRPRFSRGLLVDRRVRPWIGGGCPDQGHASVAHAVIMSQCCLVPARPSR